jgi:hypothetical protein
MRIRRVGVDVAQGVVGEPFRSAEPNVIAGAAIEREKRVCATS